MSNTPKTDAVIAVLRVKLSKKESDYIDGRREIEIDERGAFMKVFGYYVARARYRRYFRWRPEKATHYITPPVYAWGWWNFCKVNVDLGGW